MYILHCCSHLCLNFVQHPLLLLSETLPCRMFSIPRVDYVDRSCRFTLTQYIIIIYYYYIIVPIFSHPIFYSPVCCFCFSFSFSQTNFPSTNFDAFSFVFLCAKIVRIRKRMDRREVELIDNFFDQTYCTLCELSNSVTLPCAAVT